MRPLRIAAVAGCLVIGACTSATRSAVLPLPATSPWTSAAPATAAPATMAHAPQLPPRSVAPGDQWLAEPAATPQPGWTYFDWDDPAFGLALPGTWSLSELQHLEVGEDYTAVQRTAIAASNELIGSGAIRLAAHGDVSLPSGPGSPIAIVVIVQAGDRTLDACADRVALWLSASFASPWVRRSVAPVRGARLIRLDWMAAAFDSWSTASEYLAWLPDGRCLITEFDWGGTYGQVVPSYEQFALDVLSTLRPH